MRAAIEKHAAGGQIKEIEKETKKEGLVYEAEVLKDGKEFDILVSVQSAFFPGQQHRTFHSVSIGCSILFLLKKFEKMGF